MLIEFEIVAETEEAKQSSLDEICGDKHQATTIGTSQENPSYCGYMVATPLHSTRRKQHQNHHCQVLM
jgi:hypothetical protein